ncbi:hypothetical protein Agub_g9625, partial [Astrephomene gubernaculifera]
VSQLLSARSAAAADSALAGLQGGVGAAVGGLRAALLDLLVELEARLDFDEDLPPLDLPWVKRKIGEVQARVDAALRTQRAGSLLRRGLQVAIVGQPNVGKSSLLNAWTDSDRAIVTPTAGTTRDVVEAALVVGGVPVTLLDTAGIRHSEDEAEMIGVERSRAAAAAADVVVMVVDGAAGWTAEDGEIHAALWGGEGGGGGGCKVRGPALLVANKDDLRGAGSQHCSGTGSSSSSSSGSSTLRSSSRDVRSSSSNGSVAEEEGVEEAEAEGLVLPPGVRSTFAGVVRTSAAQRRGLQDLDAALLRLAGAPQLAAGGVAWAVNERQAEALLRCREALSRLSESVAADLPLDFWTIDLRSAVLALGEVSGQEVGEEVLEAVFSRFCIGK